MSILYCEKCALCVDTDWDTDTLVEVDGEILCPRCRGEEEE